MLYGEVKFVDKYEYKLRLEQLKKLYKEEKYTEAAKVADTVDWRKVKDWSTLAMVINIYDAAGQLEDAKNVCILAYNRKLGSRRLVYKLCELLIRLEDTKEAEEVYEEYVRLAPNDINRYTLLYRLNIAKGAGIDKLIAILNEYRELDRDENCLYELACLYEKSGQIEKCMATCDEIILWFNGGDYFESALKLKKRYGALTHNQKMMLERIDSLRENPYNAKKRTVTIELPKGILKAEDIIKVATGGIDTKAVNEAVTKLENMETPKVSAETSGHDAAASKEDGTAKRIAMPDIAVNKKERPKVTLREDRLELKKPDLELPYDIQTDAQGAQEEKAENPEVSENKSSIAKTKEFPKVEVSESIDAVADETDGSLSEETLSDAEDRKAAEQELLKEHTRNIGQLPIDPLTYEENKSNTIKIPIPDYANYDTVNIQKELAESIRPYIDDMYEGENEALSDAEHVSDGDIITTDEGVFRVEQDTRRIIVAGPNYKMVNVLDELDTQSAKNAQEPSDTPEESEKISETDETEQILEAEHILETEQAAAVETANAVADSNEAIENEEPVTDSDEPDRDANDYDSDEASLINELSSIIEAEVATTREEDTENAQTSSADAALVNDEPEAVCDSNAGSEEAVSDETEPETSGENEESHKEDIRKDDGDNGILHTQEINVAILKSLSKVGDGQYDEVSSVFESKLESVDEEEEEYHTGYDEVFEECFGRYTNIKGMKKQVCDAIDKMSRIDNKGTSNKGNLVIAGNKSINKADLAIAFVRALNRIYPDQKRKIAKTDADSLNKRGVTPVMDKLLGCALIIDNASELSGERVDELMKIMSGNTSGMMVILLDTESSVLRFLGTNTRFSKYFDNLIEIRKYNVNELVEMAKDYAKEKNCVINDRVLLKLYLVIDRLNTGEDMSDINMTHDIIDSAIIRANQRLSKGFLGKMRKKKSDGQDSVISLKESDISEDIIKQDNQEEETDE